MKNYEKPVFTEITFKASDDILFVSPAQLFTVGNELASAGQGKFNSDWAEIMKEYK